MVFLSAASYILETAGRLSVAFWSIGGAVSGMRFPILFIHIFVLSDVPKFLSTNPMGA